MATVKKTFSTFQEDTDIKLADRFIGFSNTKIGGERKWTFQSLIDNLNTKSPSSVKAWVQFDIKDSKWVIKSSFNVASVTKGTHNTASWNYYVSNINFIDPMPSKDYAVVASYNMPYDNSDQNLNYWAELWPVNAQSINKNQCRLFHYSSQSYSHNHTYIFSVVVVSK